MPCAAGATSWPRRGSIAAVLSLAAVSGVFGTKLNDLLSNRFDLPGTESEHARTLLADHFGQRPDSALHDRVLGRHRAGRAGGRAEARRERPPGRPHRPAAAGRPGPHVRRRSTPRLEPQPAALRVEPMRAGDGHRGGRARLRQRPGRDQPRPPAGLRLRPPARRGDRDPDRGPRAADRVRHARRRRSCRCSWPPAPCRSRSACCGCSRTR